MLREGSGFFRIEVEVEHGDTRLKRAAAYDQVGGVKVDPGGGPAWLPAGSVLCFSPDDLQLIKGAPAGRRRFLDDAICLRIPSHHRTLLDYQKVLAQRNSFLHRAKAGLTRLADISTWDRQLAALAVRIHAARREHCRALTPYFEAAYREVAGGEAELEVRHDSQLTELGSGDELEGGLVSTLADRWSEDLERLSTGTGTHRDDTEFLLAGRSLKPFGSQGEQRAAALALILADCRLGLEAGETPLLLLDDVMSELDPDRRRRLLAALAPGDGEAASPEKAQTIITAADAGLFTEAELAGAFVLEVASGAVREARAGLGV